MSKNRLRIGAVALGSAAALGIAGVSAGAATPSATPQTLASIQAQAAAAITLRVNDLNAAITKVNNAKDLGSDASSLVAYLQNDMAPLQALGQKIAGDTSIAAAYSDFTTVFTNFRVLALVLPAAQMAATSDGIDVTAIPNLTAFSAKAQARVKPANQATLQPLINELNTRITAATNGTSGVASTMLGYTPAEWNANHDLLAPSHGSVQAAVGNVTKARSYVQQIRALKSSGTTAVAPATTPTTAS